MRQRQHGFTAIESIVAVAVVVLVAAGGYTAWHRHSPAKNAHPGWIAYRSMHSKISFLYPSSWKLTQGPANGYILEQATLAGPNNFRMDFELETNHTNPAMSCALEHFGIAVGLAHYTILPTLDPKNEDNISTVNLMLPPYAGRTSGCSLGFYPNPVGKTMGFVFSAGYMSGEAGISKPANTYFNLPEMQTARSIFSSFTQ